ncbi:hypothetical protein L873DRAFT_1791716 [Choiromyces venosus 120613-1]|uniref:Uncharacterized protein n=1 Tax=Choiromyces venosus 120613-1 TaxID=1336337 RepID=A0A3N4IT53_9PEZI|nr:hypothetical protein L873DRAFT_1796314 [Choiromyces venosus 120613-1]RPA96226.1 hypothetical protein L873DRAFT_1791716 [Choiromyces venosus 120613-1]
MLLSKFPLHTLFHRNPPFLLPFLLPTGKNQKSHLSTKNAPKVLASFFKPYNYAEYTFAPQSPPDADAEFARLVRARKWGEKNVAKHRKRLQQAVLIGEFFEKFEEGGKAGGYVYDVGSDYIREFWRMCKVKGWAKGSLVQEKARKELEGLAGVKIKEVKMKGGSSQSTGDKGKAFEGRTPVEEFLLRHQHPGYMFANGSPEVEFQALVKAEQGAWEMRDPGIGERVSFEDTKEFKALKKGFNAAMDEYFDAILGEEKSPKHPKSWNILFEQFGLGEPPEKHAEAEETLKAMFVNIKDYLELLHPHKNATGTHKPKSPIDFHRLRFPNCENLAIYSYVTCRIRKARQPPLKFFLQYILRELGKSNIAADAMALGSTNGPQFRVKVREYLRVIFPEDWRELDEEIEQWEKDWKARKEAEGKVGEVEEVEEKEAEEGRL